MGSDENKFKSTYPALLTIEGAKEKLQSHLQKGKNRSCHASDLDIGLLVEIADMIAFKRSLIDLFEKIRNSWYNEFKLNKDGAVF